MYLKERYWLSKHTKKKRDESKNRFKERFCQRFNRKAAQYIADFEGMEFSLDNDLDDKGWNKMEASVIGVPSPPSTISNDENSKAFFTLLSLVEKAGEMATNLTNRSFSYSLITIGKVSLNHISLANATNNMSDINLFAYIATNQYSSDNFYEIIIDTGIFKYFITDYGQFMTYTRDIKDTTINIANTGTIDIQFGIGSILSMGFVLI